MQLSKPKLTVEFVKTFETPVYSANIDLRDVDLKTFIIEENREDVKVIYEGFKDLVSNVEFEIVDDVLNIKIESRDKTGVSSATKLYSVFTMENKLSIFLPTHFKKYAVNGDNSNLRINNLLVESVDVAINHGSVKVKYCEAKENISIKSENAFVSLKSITAKDVVVNNDHGITKVRNTSTEKDLTLKSENGVIQAKDVDSNNTIIASTNTGSIDFDDVYAKDVKINAKTGVVNYFNGNFNKVFNVDINVEQGLVRTNVNREEIH